MKTRLISLVGALGALLCLAGSAPAFAETDNHGSLLGLMTSPGCAGSPSSSHTYGVSSVLISKSMNDSTCVGGLLALGTQGNDTTSLGAIKYNNSTLVVSSRRGYNTFPVPPVSGSFTTQTQTGGGSRGS